MILKRTPRQQVPLSIRIGYQETMWNLFLEECYLYVHCFPICFTTCFPICINGEKKKVKANPFLPKDIILPDKQMITTKDKQMITSSQVGPIFIPLSVMITPLVLGFKILHWLWDTHYSIYWLFLLVAPSFFDGSLLSYDTLIMDMPNLLNTFGVENIIHFHKFKHHLWMANSQIYSLSFILSPKL